MVPVVSVIGHQKSGKTTLITRLIPLFRARGLRVGVVKHAPCEGSLDQFGKDSFRYQQAGAEKTLIISATHGAFFFTMTDEASLKQTIEWLFHGFDLVLVEGFKEGPFPKIEVFRRSDTIDVEPLARKIDVIALVTDACVSLPNTVPVLSPQRPEEIASFLERTFV